MLKMCFIIIMCLIYEDLIILVSNFVGHKPNDLEHKQCTLEWNIYFSQIRAWAFNVLQKALKYLENKLVSVNKMLMGSTNKSK